MFDSVWYLDHLLGSPMPFLSIFSLLLIALSLIQSVSGLYQVENNCSPAVLAGLSPRARAYALAQPAIDIANDVHTPRLHNYHFESVPQLGHVELGKRLGRSATGIAFELSSHPEFVIKYQSNCMRRDKAIHPLLMDYWLGVEAAALDVSAKPLFVSPAAALSGTRGPKVDFTMDFSELDRCARLGGVVRFMVIERLGVCMRDMVPDPDLGQAVVVGMHALYLLERLHSAGIYHGDMHSGNICVSQSDHGMLRLIDFESGGFVESETDGAHSVRMNTHHMLTEWQLLGHAFGRRDDIYKTIEMIGTIAIGQSLWVNPLRWARTNGGRLLEWKQTGSLFEPYLWSLPIVEQPDITYPQRQRIITLLNGVHYRARQLVSVHSPIPYQEIMAELKAVYNLIRFGTEVVSTTSTVPTTEVLTPKMPSDSTDAPLATTVAPVTPTTRNNRQIRETVARRVTAARSKSGTTTTTASPEPVNDNVPVAAGITEVQSGADVESAGPRRAPSRTTTTRPPFRVGRPAKAPSRRGWTTRKSGIVHL